jgi:hypothetical protein
MTATSELIARHCDMTRDYISAEKLFATERGNARAKDQFDHVCKVMDELAPALWQHQPAARFDQIVWAERMLKGAMVFLICRENVAMFRNARDHAEVILRH